MDKWTHHWLTIARATAVNLSKDPSTRVGAVAVADRRLLSSGYNGFPKGFGDDEHRLANRAFKIKYVVHAEQNCIYNAGMNGAKLAGADLFVYGLPICRDCAKAAVQAGFKRIFSCHDVPVKGAWQESCDEANYVLDECGVEHHSYSFEEYEGYASPAR